MEVKELLPGSKVDIRIVQRMMRDNPKDEKDSVYYSTIYDINEDDSLEMNMPLEGQKLRILPKHIRYEFIFTMNQGIYKAEGTVIEHLKKGTVYLLKARLTSPLQKMQRREYFRIACLIPVAFVAMDEYALSCESVQQMKEYLNEMDDLKVQGSGTLLDISGGGTRFVSINSLKEVKYLLLQFQLPLKKGMEDIEVTAQVIETTKVKGEDKYIHRVKFFFQDSRTKERLIHYIFEEERRIRKKEQGN